MLSKVTKAVELLLRCKLISEGGDFEREAKLRAIVTIGDIVSSSQAQASVEFPRILPLSIIALMRILQDGDMSVWSLAEQMLVKMYKSLLRRYHEIIILEVWKCVKGQERKCKGFADIVIKMEGRSRRFAIQVFSIYASKIKPSKLLKFRKLLIKVLSEITQQKEDQLLQETLSKYFNSIALYQLSNSTVDQLEPLLNSLVKNIQSNHSRVRRSAVLCLSNICKHSQHKADVIQAITSKILSLLKEESAKTQAPKEINLLTFEEPIHKEPSSGIPANSPLVQGVLLALREILKVSEGAENFLVHNLYEFSVISLGAIQYTQDSNVVVGALELLEQIVSSHWHQTIASYQKHEEDFNSYFEKVLTFLSGFLQISTSRVSVYVLVVSCYCSLARQMHEIFLRFYKQDALTILNFLEHTDALLRGQTYYLLGCIIDGALFHGVLHLIEDFDVVQQLQYLLLKATTDESSLAAKMACNGLSVTLNTILYSKYAQFVLYIIQQLLLFPSKSYIALKSKVISFLSKIDYQIVRHIEQQHKTKPIENLLPKDYTFHNESIEHQVLAYLISHLEDHDQRIRKKAAKSIVTLLQKVHYFGYMEDTSTYLQRSYLSTIKGEHLMSEQLIDQVMLKLLPSIHQSTENTAVKGLYSFLRALLESGYEFPGQLVNIVGDHIMSNSFATDIETQLDCLVVITRLLQNPKEVNSDYTFELFSHIMRLMHIIASIVSGKPPEEKRASEGEFFIGSIHGRYHYIQLWERLNDAYRLSLTSFDRTIFDEVTDCALLSLTRFVSIAGYKVINFIDEIIGYGVDHFVAKTEYAIDLFHTLSRQLLSDQIPGKKDLLKRFENLFIICKNTYVSSLSISLRRQILLFLTDLIVSGIHYQNVDKDLLFLKYLHHVFAPKEDQITTQSGQLRTVQLLFITAVNVKRGLFLTESLPLTFTCLSTLVEPTFEVGWEDDHSLETLKALIDLLYSIPVADVVEENDYHDANAIASRMRDEILCSVVERIPHTNAIQLLEHILRLSKRLDKKTWNWLYKKILLNTNRYSNQFTIKDTVRLQNILKEISLDMVDIHELKNALQNCHMESDMWLFKATFAIEFMLSLHRQTLDSASIESLLDGHGPFESNMPDMLRDILQGTISKLFHWTLNTSNLSDEIKTSKMLAHVLTYIKELVSLLNESKLKDMIQPIYSKEIKAIQKLVQSHFTLLISNMGDLFEVLGESELLKTMIDHVNLDRWDASWCSPSLTLNYFRTQQQIDTHCDKSMLKVLIEFQQDPSIATLLMKGKGKLDELWKEFIAHEMLEFEQLSYSYISKLTFISRFMLPSKELILFMVQTFMNSSVSHAILCKQAVLYIMAELKVQKDLFEDKEFVEKLLGLKISKSWLYRIFGMDITVSKESDPIESLKMELSAKCDILNIKNNIILVIQSIVEGSTFPYLKIQIRDLNVSIEDSSTITNEDTHIIPTISTASWPSHIDAIGTLSQCLETHKFEILDAVSASSWIMVAAISLKTLNALQCRFQGLLSLHEIHKVLFYTKQIFYYFEFTLDLLNTHSILNFMIHEIYNLSCVLFPWIKRVTSMEMIENTNPILSHLWNILTDPLHDRGTLNPIQIEFIFVLETLAQSSLSLEMSVYPFQDDPINYDFNHEPTEILKQFVCLISTIPPRYPATFEKLWHQIVIGVDPKSKIHPDATSEKIKTLSFKALNILLLKEGFNTSSDLVTMEIADSESFNVPIVFTDSLRDNFVYLWKDLNISSLIDEYIDLISPYVNKYISFVSTEVELGKECLRGIVLLADLFVPNQRVIVKDILFRALDTQTEVYDEDLIAKISVLLGISKILPSFWRTHPETKEVEDLYIQKLLKHFKLHITNQRLRRCPAQDDDKTMIPFPRSLLFLSLFYILQNDAFRRVFLNDPLVSNYLRKMNGKEIVGIEDPKSPIPDIIKYSVIKPSQLAMKMLNLAEKYGVDKKYEDEE